MFTTNPKEIDFTLNYESSASNPDDEAIFSDLGNIIEANVHDHTDAGSLYQRSQRLTGTADATIGSVLTIPVGSGDRVSASVYAKYLAPTATNNPGVAIGALLAAAISGGTGGTTYEGAINSSYGTSGSIITNLFNDQVSATEPMAFINLLFLPGEGASSIDPGQFTFKQIGSASSNAHALLTLDEPFEAPGAGHVVVYLSNESEVLTEVYFDDLVITVNEHPVVQTADYYPFGLTFNSFQRVTAKENRWKFQDKESIDDLELGLIDFGWRHYDPSIARWTVQDPLADDRHWLSPYNFVQNNPVILIDPDGMLDDIIHIDGRDDIVIETDDPYDNHYVLDDGGLTYVGTTEKGEGLTVLDGSAVTVEASYTGPRAEDDPFVQRAQSEAAAIEAANTKYPGTAEPFYFVETPVETIASTASDLANGDFLMAGASTLAIVPFVGKPTKKAIKRALAAARQRAVRQAWKKEAALIRRTGQGSRDWTRAEIKELLSTGKVKGYIGHHINSIKGYPNLAGNPANIEFVERASHIKKHGGNFQNVTSGPLINRD